MPAGVLRGLGPAPQRLVAPLVLRDALDARILPGGVGALLEPLGLLGQRDAGVGIRRPRLVGVLGEENGEVPRAALAQAALALDRVQRGLEAWHVGERGLVGVGVGLVGGAQHAVGLVGEAVDVRDRPEALAGALARALERVVDAPEGADERQRAHRHVLGARRAAPG